MTLQNELSPTAHIPRHGPRLGELLLQRDLIGSRELKTALAQQQKMGGHLGTNLLENGAITEARLLEALGEQHSTQTVSASELRDVPESVLKLIPPRLARRHLLIPFRLAGRTLFLAAVEPEAVLLVEDEIRMFTSCLVRTHIGLEFRVREAILRNYGGPEDARLESLVRRLSLIAGAQPSRPGALVYPAGSTVPTDLDESEVPAAPELPPTSIASPSGETEPPDPDVDTDTFNVTVVLDRVDASAASVDESRRRPLAVDPKVLEESGEDGGDLADEDPGAVDTSDTQEFPRTTLEETAERPSHPQPSSSWAQFEAVSEPVEDAGAYAERAQEEALGLQTRVLPALAADTTAPDPTDLELEAPEELTEELTEETAEETATVEPLPRSATAGETPIQGAAAALHPVEISARSLEELRPQLQSTEPDLRLEEAALLLQQAEMRDDVADAMLEFCSPYFRRCLLFARRRGEIVGWRFEGQGVAAKPFDELRLPIVEDVIFTSLEVEGTVHCGPLPKEPPLPPKLYAALRQQVPRECVVVPIRVAGRVACYLWADNIHGFLGRAPLAQLQRLSRKAGLALEICVLRNRIRTA